MTQAELEMLTLLLQRAQEMFTQAERIWLRALLERFQAQITERVGQELQGDTGDE